MHAQVAGNPVSIDLRTETSRATTVQLLTQQSVQAKQGAEALATQMGWPIRGTFLGGQQFELMEVSEGRPRYYVTVNANAAISTAANRVRNTAPYSVNGLGYTVGIWDGGGVRSTHQEFGGRVSIKDGAAVGNHATHVGGTIGASGVMAAAMGMAPNVSIDSYEWTSDLAEMSSRAATGPGQAGKIHISNHSYGYLTGWSFDGSRWFFYGVSGDREDRSFGQYSQAAVQWDSLHYNAPYYLAFKAAANDRSDPAPAAGTTYYYFNGVAWVAKTYNPATDPFADGWDQGGFDTMEEEACAKNIMTVGAVNDAVSGGVRYPANGTMTYFSNWGPTDDGRIKPDIVANGVNLYSSLGTSDSSYDGTYSGTSMATPNAAGSAILLVDYYGKLFPGQAMRASTLKGLILHTADDLGVAGPDYAYGWGLMNAEAAANQIKAHADAPTSLFLREGQLTTGNPSESFMFTWDGVSPIRATICWTDPAGTTKTGLDDRTAVLVNDLDLRITGPGNTPVYYPYVLNVNSPTTAATTGDNVVDNVEQIRIAAPSAGAYTLTVSHKRTLAGGKQDYSLTLSGQSLPGALPAPVLAAEPAVTPGTANTISWNGLSAGTEYYAECADSSNFGAPLNSGWILTTQCTFNGLTAGQTYWYRVKARQGVQESAWSNVESSQQEALPAVTVTASDAAAGEPGDSGTFTFTRSGVITGALTVNFTVAGTATSGSDYSALGTSVSFVAGSSTATKTVNVLDDLSFEPSETVIVTLAAGSGYTIGSPSGATVTIADNDSPGVTITQSGGDTSVVEGGVTDTYTVVLNTQPSANVTITPNPGTQLTVNPVSLTFSVANWNVAQTVTVTAVDDSASEGNHSGTITHAATSADGNYNGIVISSVTASITDNDPAAVEVAYVTGRSLGGVRNDYNGYVGMKIAVGANPVTVTQLGRMKVSGNSGTHTIKLVRGSDGVDVAGGSVNVSMSGGTAGQFSYASLSSPVVLSAGANYYVVSLESVGGDQWYDLSTTVTTTAVATEVSGVYSYGSGLWAPNGGAGNTYGPVDFKYSGTSTPTPGTLAFKSASYTIGEAGGSVRIYVSRSGGSDGTASVNYATANSTAAAGSDYTATSGVLNWANGDASDKFFDVPILIDSAYEGNETFTANLSGATGAALGSPGTTTVTIVDDDPAPVEVAYVTGRVLGALRNDYNGYVGMKIAVGANPVTVTQLGRMKVSGNSGTHTIKLVRGSDGVDVAGGSVNVSMSGGTAGQFSYASLSSPVVLSAGANYYVVSLESVGGDQWYDLSTTVTTTAVATEVSGVYSYGSGLWAPNGGAGNTYGPVDFKYSGTSTPTPGTLAFKSASYTIGEAGGSVRIYVSRSGGSDGTASVNYATANSTAAAGSDYTATSGVLNWANGDASDKFFDVPILIDSAYEGNETFTANLSGATGAALGSPGTTTVTIVDDDPAPVEVAYVTGRVLGALRNDYNGYVGMKIAVGANPVTVTQLGRMKVSGNSGTHTIKLVRGSDGVDVAGGSVNVSMSGGTAGQFSYASLSSPVVLSAGANYYVVSLESVGGDQWYDLNTTVTTTAVATEVSGVYSYGSGLWAPNGGAGNTYGPVDFKYSAAGGSAVGMLTTRRNSPSLAIISGNSEAIVLELRDGGAQSHAVESSLDLINWDPLPNISPARTGRFTLPSSMGQRFYRLVPASPTK